MATAPGNSLCFGFITKIAGQGIRDALDLGRQCCNVIAAVQAESAPCPSENSSLRQPGAPCLKNSTRNPRTSSSGRRVSFEPKMGNHSRAAAAVGSKAKLGRASFGSARARYVRGTDSPSLPARDSLPASEDKWQTEWANAWAIRQANEMARDSGTRKKGPVPVFFGKQKIWVFSERPAGAPKDNPPKCMTRAEFSAFLRKQRRDRRDLHVMNDVPEWMQILKPKPAMPPVCQVMPDRPQAHVDRWLIDSGSGQHVVPAHAVEHCRGEFIPLPGGPQRFSTANGMVEATHAVENLCGPPGSGMNSSLQCSTA